jgi:type VI protein secretion system component VasF
VALFKQRKNKRFNYKPRFLKDEREKVEKNLESQWQEIRASKKRKGSILTSLPFLVLFLIAVLVLFYILSQYETT